MGDLAIGVYYVLYARTINKRIREGKHSGKKFGMNAKQEIAQIEEEAMKSDTDKMPDYLDYAKERGSVTVVVD